MMNLSDMEFRVIKTTRPDGITVWQHPDMDFLRQGHCLCLNCDIMGECGTAKSLGNICVSESVLLAVTRCPKYRK
jgi:hypothetical protein